MRSRARAELSRQLAKFAAVGVVNTLLSFGVYAALLDVHVGFLVAAPVAFAAGAANGYLLNRRWTFGCCGSPLRYAIVQLGGLLLTDLLLELFTHAVRAPRADYAATLATVTLSTFSANQLWAFSASVGRSATR